MINAKFTATASANEAMMFVAQIAGHRKSKSPPGWQVIAEGLRELELMRLGWEMAKK